MSVFRMRKFRLLYILFFVALVYVGGSPSDADAGIPVMDGTNLVQNLISALQNIMSVVNEGTQIGNQATQISNQIQQLQNQARELSTLNGMGFGLVNALANQNVTELNNLVSQAQGIHFNTANVSNEFDAMFPQGTDWNTIPISQYNTEFGRWNQNLSDAAKFAMNAQGIVNRVRANYNRIVQVLNQANGADGEVRQIQAANQSLAVVSSQLGDITQTLVAGQRLTSTQVAAAASEKAAQAEYSTRLRTSYTNRGPAAPTHASLPQPR